jgi:hypothetical protein
MLFTVTDLWFPLDSDVVVGCCLQWLTCGEILTLGFRYDEATVAAVTFESVKSSMYAARKELTPDVPSSLEALYNEMIKDSLFVQNFGLDSAGRLMCKGISGPAGHRAVLFSTSTMISVLLSATWLFLDGTFSVRPKFPKTRQLLVISALHLGSVSILP